MLYLAGVIAAYMFVSAGRQELPVWSAGVAESEVPGLDTPIGPIGSRVTGPLLHPLICCIPPYLPADGFPNCEAIGDDGCCPVRHPRLKLMIPA